MSSIYLGDHIAGNHIHTEILTGNMEEPQQKYHFEKFSYTLLGGGLQTLIRRTKQLILYFKSLSKLRARV